jgi:murein DD-endopeptidase MepM/ murein hydrolase activator NlpD
MALSSAFTKRMEEYLSEIRARNQRLQSGVESATAVNQEIFATPTLNRPPDFIQERALQLGNSNQPVSTAVPQVPQEMSFNTQQPLQTPSYLQGVNVGGGTAPKIDFLERARQDALKRDQLLQQQQQPSMQSTLPADENQFQGVMNNQSILNDPRFNAQSSSMAPTMASAQGSLTQPIQPTQAQPIDPNSPLMKVANGGATIVDNYGEKWDKNYPTVHSFNPGIDVAANVGDPVQAVVGGQIALARFVRGYGNTVIVDSGDGDIQMYAYLNDLNVQPGQAIQTGMLLGSVGTTGLSDTPSLHFEVRRGNSAQEINPVQWLQQKFGGAGTASLGGAF